MNKSNQTIREAVGVFKEADSLQSAIDDLRINGFARREISVLADDKTIQAKLGHIYKRVQDAEDDPKAPRSIFVPLESIGDAEGALIGTPLYLAGATATGLVVASGGSLLATLIAASLASTAGAAIGVILAHLVAKHHADYIQSQIERGGLLLWVHLRSKEMENKAKKILKEHSGFDIHVHKIKGD